MRTVRHPTENDGVLSMRIWEIQPDVIIDGLHSGWKARDISAYLLNDEESTAEVEDTCELEEASNWPLAIFEQALDWRLGEAVLSVFRWAVQKGKKPKPFRIGVTRAGDIFVMFQSGKVVKV